MTKHTNKRRKSPNRSNISPQRQRKRRKRRNQQLALRVTILVVILLAAFLSVRHAMKVKGVIGTKDETEVTKVVETAPDFEVQLLDINEYSRPGTALDQVKGIVVHYTANPGTTAQQNRDYFDGLKDSHETKASSHFVIGMEGEIIQCIPTAEISYASNDRNVDTLAIECCVPDETGQFTQATYDSLVHMVAWLCGKFDLTTADVIRHYDVTGKNCPKYYVEHEDAWDQFKQDVDTYIEVNGVSPEEVAE